MLDHDKRAAYPLVIRYLTLIERFGPALRDLSVRARAHPEKPAPPVLVALVAHLMAETFRIVSREPFGRRLARLRPDATLSFAELLLRLEEADAVADPAHSALRRHQHPSQAVRHSRMKSSGGAFQAKKAMRPMAE